MKWVYRFILPVLLLLSIETKSQVYTYIPLPDSNVVWNGYYKYCFGSQPCIRNRETYFTNGDTILNSQTYHKVFKGTNFLFAFIREDTSRKIFFIAPYDTSLQEKTVCDFSLSKGDTMFSGQHYFVVISDDTINYNGILRRTLSIYLNAYLNDGIIDEWIEGIGSIATPAGHFIPCNCNERVVCSFFQDSVLLFSKTGDVGCSLLFNDIDQLDFDANISVYPNPSTTSFTLQLSQVPTTQTYFHLYDALGRQVKREEISSVNTTLSRDNLPSGIYFWQLQSENKIVGRGKVVVE